MKPRKSDEVTSTEKLDRGYKVICVSLYNDDLARLDSMVGQIRTQPKMQHMSRSKLIRIALNNIDVQEIVKEGVGRAV